MKMAKFMLAVVLLFVSLCPAAAVAAGPTKLTKLSGSVYIKKSGAFKEVKASDKMSVSEGDIIRTDSDGLVTIIYGDGTETMLDNDTEVRISKLQQGQSNKISVTVTSGKVWNKVKKLVNADDAYDLETPTMVMGVRGTLYLSSFNAATNKSGLYVFDGVVAGRLNAFLNGTAPLNELPVGVNQQLEVVSIGDPLPGKTELDIQSIIDTTNPKMLAQMIYDILTEAARHLQEAKQSGDPNKIREALTLAARAAALAQLGHEMLDALSHSNKWQQVNQALWEFNTNIYEVQQQISVLWKEALATLEQLKEAAIKAGLSQQEIDAAARPPAGDPVTAPPSGNGGAPVIPPAQDELTLTIETTPGSDGATIVHLSGRTPDDEVIVKVTRAGSQLVYYNILTPSNGQYADQFSLWSADRSHYGTYTVTVGKENRTVTQTFTVVAP